ncbi:MAG TPA: hypothetical protein VFG50_17615, partial [Rhodothermales bacterium]|nr:hypothetical protein [Rhodothermales bacterium]
NSTRPPTPPEDRPKRQGLAIATSILISCMLWFTFTMQENYVRVVQLPTTVRNLPVDQALSELPPKKVRVEMQGPGWQLIGLFGFFDFGSDLPVVPMDASQDQVNLEAAVQSISLNKNVLIRSVTPLRVDLHKEQRILVKVPVKLVADIETPPTHFLVSPPAIIPDSVTVSGARSVVGDLAFWPTEPFEVLDLRDSVVARIPLADTLSGLVARDPDSVILKARAKEFTQGTRQIDVVVRGATEQFVRLEPSVVTVQYRVPLDQFDAVETAPDFFADVEYRDILADTTGRLRPQLHIPEGYDIRDVEMTPPTVRAFQIINP